MTTTLALATITLFVGFGCVALAVGRIVAVFGRDAAEDLREADARAREHAEGKGE